MDKATEREVRRRSRGRCEYCLVPESTSTLKFPIDHVISRQHRGKTELSNLALACGACNRHKGPNIAGLDPETETLTRLFNPCSDRWTEHFQWNEGVIVRISPIGRTTVALLEINQPFRVAAREALLGEGLLKVLETERAE